MFTPRRSAQLALGAASLTLVTCITVLVAGSTESAGSSSSASVVASHVSPLASSQLVNIQANISQQIAKR